MKFQNSRNWLIIKEFLRQPIIESLKAEGRPNEIILERTYKPHYHYQNLSPLANGTDLNKEKYAILQTQAQFIYDGKFSHC